jgi:hypothetical protein
MAQFFTDFTGATVGADPPTGWTERWDASGNWRVGTGPVVEWEDIPFTARYDFLSWNTPGSVSGEVEVFAEFRTTSGSGGQCGVVIQGQSGATSGYYMNLAFGGLGFDEIYTARIDSGTDNGLANTPFTWATGTLYSVRMRKFSDNIVRVRVWASSGSEPGTWNFSSTADTTYSSGLVGLFARNPNGVKTFTRFGVGTAGDAAPTSATSTPTISSVSDATIEPGQTGVVITGTGFSSSGNTVRISPTNNVADAGAVTQTITAQSTTSITITGVKGALAFETGAFLFVTNNASASNASGTSVQFVARPFVRENLIGETGAAVASETGITMVVYHTVPTTGSPNPAQVITGVASNGAGAIDVQLARGALALNAPVWVVLMKDGSPAKGTVRKVTPVYE